MVATVKSSGATSASSSHVTGAETGAPAFGRTLQAEAIVRSRALAVGENVLGAVDPAPSNSSGVVVLVENTLRNVGEGVAGRRGVSEGDQPCGCRASRAAGSSMAARLSETVG